MRKPPVPAWLRVVREPLVPYDVAGITAIEGKVRSPKDVYTLLRGRLEQEEQEVFIAVLLDAQSHVRGLVEVSRGTLTGSLVSPRETFRAAIIHGAAGIVVAHNHPSGDPTPSADDRAATRMLVEAGRVLDIPLHDHVIIGAGRYTSLAECGLL